MMKRQLELRREETRAIHEYVSCWRIIEDSGLNEDAVQEM